MCLPWEGALLWGRLSNLSFGGCYIEDVPLLESGTRTEVLLRVNTLPLRAIGHVRTALDHSGIGIEFVRMTASGRQMLAELLEELERFRSAMHAPAQVEPGEGLQRTVKRLCFSTPSRAIPIVGEVVPACTGEAAAALQRRLQSWKLSLPDSSLDLLA